MATPKTNPEKIFDNAIVSIELGIKDFLEIPNDSRRALSAVRNIFAGILLLFKSKLAELSINEDEALIKTRVLPKKVGNTIKWIGEGSKTVDVNEIKDRFKSLDISVDWNILNKIQKYRNDIEHYFDQNDTQTSVVGQYISESFVIIYSFIREYCSKDPITCFSEEIWNAFINEQTVYEKAQKEGYEKLDSLHWFDIRILNEFKKMECPICGSSLIEPTQNNKEASESIFQCRTCSETFNYDELVDGICDSIKRHSLSKHSFYEYEDDPVVRCPNCDEEAYITNWKLCLKCGEGPIICERCEEEVPVEDFPIYEETRMCGWCAHMAEKDD